MNWMLSYITVACIICSALIQPPSPMHGVGLLIFTTQNVMCHPQDGVSVAIYFPCVVLYHDNTLA